MRIIEITKFEIKYQICRIVTWAYVLIFLFLLFLVMDEIIDFALTIGGVILNSPMTIANLTGFSNKMGLLVIALIAGKSVTRDISSRLSFLFFSFPISKLDFLLGRFIGTVLLSSFYIFVAVPICLSLSIYLGKVNPEIVGEVQVLAYLKPFFYLTLPNVIIASTFGFFAAVFFKNSQSGFLGVGVFLFLSVITVGATGNWGLEMWLDPSATSIVAVREKLLSPLELHVAHLELSKALLLNRIFWIGVCFLLWIGIYKKFSLSHQTDRKSSFRKKKEINQEEFSPIILDHSSIVLNNTNQIRRDQKIGIKSVILIGLSNYKKFFKCGTAFLFPGILFSAVLFLSYFTKGPLGVDLKPTADILIPILGSVVIKFLISFSIIFLSGQIMWREKDSRMNALTDILPIRNGMMFLSKYLELCCLVFSLVLCLFLSGIIFQFLKGMYTLDVLQFIYYIFGIQLTEYLFFALFCLSAHALINNKYLSIVALVTVMLYSIYPEMLGVEHKLFIFGSDPGIFNPPFVQLESYLLSWIVFKMYWLGWILFFTIFAIHLWPRLTSTSFGGRIRSAAPSLKRAGAPFFFSFFLITGSGSYIFYQTNLINSFSSSQKSIGNRIRYEKNYSRFKKVSQPRIHASKMILDIFPDLNNAKTEISYILRNFTEEKIDSIHFTLPFNSNIKDWTIEGNGKVVKWDKELGYLIYKLEFPMLPDGETTVIFTAEYASSRFTNEGLNTTISNDYVWIKSQDWLPSLGYQKNREVEGKNLRERKGLPIPTSSSLSDYEAANIFDSSRSKIQFEFVISVPSHMTAIAPGALLNSWKKGERKFFSYRTDNPIRDMFHIYAGKYKVQKSNWNNIQLKIFYLEDFSNNLKSMEAALKTSLSHYSKNFGPYPHNQLSLVQTPDEGIGGISLPGTIGYSTKFALLKAESEFDIVFAVIAHEVAHQWWGHQLIPAKAKGGEFLTESISWYSALEVIEEEKGAEQLRSFLDEKRKTYLNPRSKADVPLLQADSYYLAYEKGLLALYALKEYLGEKKIDSVLSGMLENYTSGNPPYPTSVDFYHRVQKVTPDSLKYLVRDLLKKNVFWNLRVNNAELAEKDDGTWEVKFDVEVGKVEVDKEGVEVKREIGDFFEIGVYRKDGEGNPEPIILKNVFINKSRSKFTFKLNERPVMVGIDPRNLLIDTEIRNNLVRID